MSEDVMVIIITISSLNDHHLADVSLGRIAVATIAMSIMTNAATTATTVGHSRGSS